MNRTDKEVIDFFKDNENNMYKLKSIYTELLKSQRYYLAKLYKNKIEILEHLEKFELDNNEERKLKNIFMEEGLKRASQNNFNQAEAGYNAKWFKRGAFFGYEMAKDIFNRDVAIK